MHIRALVISASPRTDSSSLRVARCLQHLLDQHHIETRLVDFQESDIPCVGRGAMDPEHLSPFQERWIGGLRGAHLVLCAVPEYNWTLPGLWLDALHQTGVHAFADVFGGRVFATVGVSSGRGGRRPALLTNTVLAKLISFLGQDSVVAPGIFESHETASCLTRDGRSLGNQAYDAGLQRFLDAAITMAQRCTGAERTS